MILLWAILSVTMIIYSSDPEVSPVALKDALDSADKIWYYLIQCSATDELQLFVLFKRTVNSFDVSHNVVKKQHLIMDILNAKLFWS